MGAPEQWACVPAALSSQKAVMPEDAIDERERRLHGNDDSLDDIDELTAGSKGGLANNDLETGQSGQVCSIVFTPYAGCKKFLSYIPL